MTITLRGWTMSFDERLTWFLLGVLVGLIISWLKDIRRGEDEIKEKLDEVVEIEHQKRDRDEAGSIRFPSAGNFLLLCVVIMTVWASFSTASTNNKIEKQGDRQEIITACVQKYLYGTIQALNERTTYTQATSTANVELQKGLAEFIDILLFQPPKTVEETYAALQEFDNKLTQFVELSNKQKGKTDMFPYPTEDELSSCLGYEINTTQEDQQ